MSNVTNYPMLQSASRTAMQLVTQEYINTPTSAPESDVIYNEDGTPPTYMSHIIKGYASLSGKSATVVITLTDSFITNGTSHYVAVAIASNNKYQIFRKIVFSELLDCINHWLDNL